MPSLVALLGKTLLVLRSCTLHLGIRGAAKKKNRFFLGDLSQIWVGVDEDEDVDKDEDVDEDEDEDCEDDELTRQVVDVGIC